MARWAAFCIVLAGAAAGDAWAGGGPETTLLVANADDPASVRVAEAYARGRDLPPGHVLFLEDVPDTPVVGVEAFRERILRPIERHLEAEGLQEGIDLIAYSVGFPYAVSFQADAKAAGLELRPPISRHASLTGLTYLYRYVLDERPDAYLSLQANRYFRRETGGEVRIAPSLAFAAAKAWDEEGRPVEAPSSPHRYRLAVMLGWTGAHGNTVDEVLASLERARSSDGTFPDGTVYLMDNPNVRATTRAPWFEAVKAALEREGQKAEILSRDVAGQDGLLPRGRDDAIGILAGSASLKWKPGDAPMLPGGIGEHLTSFGAHFGTGSQTKCTEFFRHGAAGTSGTVAEPYAIAQKFPSPWIHVHYARGCSLAEAFYQSVAGPYQLLVLGDPLARPFARGVGVTVQAPDGSETVSGTVAVDATFDLPDGTSLAQKELWIDGRRVAEALPTDLLSWNAAEADEGWHELRVVAVEDGAVSTRSYASVWVEVDRDPDLDLEVEPPAAVEIGEALRLEGSADGVDEIEVLRANLTLARAPVKRGRVRVDVATTLLGLGPARLRIRGRADDGTPVWSRPLDAMVSLPAEPWAARTLRVHDALPGLHLTWTDEEGEEREAFRTKLGALGTAGARKLVLRGSFRAAGDLTGIRVRGGGEAKLRIDDREVPLVALGEGGTRRALAPLAEGWHDLVLEAEGPEEVALELGATELATIPEDWTRTERPTGYLVGKDERPAPILGDGGRAGAKGADLDAEGVTVAWEDKQRRVVAVALHPSRGKDVPAPAAEWVVETRSSTRGRWRDVHDLARIEGTPDGFLLLRFRPTTVRELRVRPAGDGAGGRLAELEVYREER